MAVQKRPYELSVWSEELFEEGQKIERKILIIGADTMTYDGRAMGIKLMRKVNGTNTLTFQMLDSFFDSQRGKMVYNDFIDELYAERKIKLFYREKWLEFYIKNVKEEKKHNSVLKTFSCEDAFIDELARNGYGITFDEELYNNVEEIGTFTEEVLEDSIWEYEPRYNWGDFTEYTEERLFKISLSNFQNQQITAYKIEYQYDDFNEKIINIINGEQRNLELSDDLARKEGYYWDQYNEASSLEQVNKKHDFYAHPVTLTQNEYRYIYVPYSCLDFCYINYDGNGTAPSSSVIPDRFATEYAATTDNNKYYIAPTQINPKALIQFIAFKNLDEINVDETGLITNKNCHYVMTLEQWNNLITSNNWYIFNDKRFIKTSYGEIQDNYEISYNYKYILNGTPAQQDLGNKCLTYDGYLNNLNNIELIKGKKISITDRTEINISDNIDAFVTVYNTQSNNADIINCYCSEDWEGNFSNYRICSRTSTRQILPSLARNYPQNSTDIEGTTGWEIMHQETDKQSIEPDIKYRLAEQEGELTYAKSYLAFLTGLDEDSKTPVEGETSEQITNNSVINPDNLTLINFGAVAQEQKIENNKIYCLGIKIKIKQRKNMSFKPSDFQIKIANGALKANGYYTLASDQLVFQLDDFGDYSDIITTNIQPWKYFYEKKANKDFVETIPGEYTNLTTKFLLFKSDIDITNPYIAITSLHDYLLEELYLFEAYTKGADYFKDGYFQLSGRDYYPPANGKLKGFTQIYLVNNLKNQILFESDIMAGDAYSYEKYFIQQLKLKDGTTYDTFMAKSYLNENYIENSLPLDKAKYSNDDFEIVTNEIDLSLCKYYQNITNKCSFKENSICYYQKYGFCPYLFETEKHCRKIRTLKGEKSNRFNLTQEISKIFKCYPVYYISHEPNGVVKKDENGKMIKKVYYITERGKDNIYGFKYGKNLSNISRNIISNQIVTKLYVNDVDSEYTNTGLCTIKTAADNPSKDSFIIDFSYYIAKGMLSATQVEQDLYGIIKQDSILNGYLKTLGYYNTKYDDLTNRIINLRHNSFDDIDAHITINIEGINVVLKEIKQYTEALAKYSDQTESSIYKNYLAKLRDAEARLYTLLNQTFEPDCDNIIEWFEELEETYEQDFGIYGFEEMIKKLKDEHEWITGLLGQYNSEYLQMQIWEKERTRYLQLINELTIKFFRKYEPYLKEGTWSDTNYLTDNAYYHGALDVSAQGSIPKIEYSISVIDLSPFEGYEDYELDNADTTYIEDVSILGYNQLTGFPNQLKVMVSEITEDLDIPTKNSIKVQNYTTQFEDLFQQVTATVQNLTLNENIYRRASNFTSQHDIKEESLQNTLINNNFTLMDASQQNVVMNRNGQSGSNVNNRSSKYKLTGEGLYFSNDGGVSWKKGVTPDQRTEGNIKTESIETERIDLLNLDGQVDASITSTGLESYLSSAGSNQSSFRYGNQGFQYLMNNLKLLQLGNIVEEAINYYGLSIKKGNNDIFNIMISSDQEQINANADYNFNGKGTFNGINDFNTSSCSVTIGGNRPTGASNTKTKEIDGVTYTYTVKSFSIHNGNQNIFTTLVTGDTFIGGTILSYSEDFPDYIYIQNGKKVQLET